MGRTPELQLAPESPSRLGQTPCRRPAELLPRHPRRPAPPRASQPETAPRLALTREVVEGRGDVLCGVAVGGIADHQAGLAHRAVADQHALDAASLGAARAPPTPGHPGPARPAPPALPARRYGRRRRRLAAGGQRRPALLRGHRGRRPRDQLPAADKGGARSALGWATVPARPRCGRACSARLPCDTGGRGKRRVRRRLLLSETTAPPSARRAGELRRRLQTVRLAKLAPPHQPTRTPCYPGPCRASHLSHHHHPRLLPKLPFLPVPQPCPLLPILLFPFHSPFSLFPLLLSLLRSPSILSSPQPLSAISLSLHDHSAPSSLPVPPGALAPPHKCLGLEG